jgi:hypothetical protein
MIVRRPGWATLLLVLVLCAGCIRSGNSDPTATVSPPAMAEASATSTGPATNPTASPSPMIAATATATVPAGQAVDLSDVELTYAIEATLRDVESGIVDALSVTTVTNREAAPLEHLFFRVAPAQFNEFSLNSLTRDGEAIDPIGSDNGTTLEVMLDPPLAPGATTELAFDFVVPLRDTGDGFASIGRDGPVMKLGFWYPMLSNDEGYPPLLDPPYTLAADYTVSFTAPADVVVAASGELTGPPTVTQDGTRYDYNLENGRDFALMLSTDYEVDARTTASGIVVRQYTLASESGGSATRQVEVRDQAFAVAEQSLAEYAARIGPYPWPSLSLVEAGPQRGGIEYTALTLISYDGALDNLVAHEIAHMWFYAAIGTRTQDDPWIDEGAATFLANGLLAGNYAISSDDRAIDFIAPLGASISDLAAIGGDWSSAVYTQGASFYADLLIEMGEDDLWTAMQDIYASQHFGIATAWEVLTTFQAHSDTDLLPVYERYFSYGWLGDVE